MTAQGEHSEERAAGSSAGNPELNEIETAARWFYSITFALIAGLSFAMAFACSDFSGGVQIFFRTFCVASAVALAAASVGGVLGFLFGIPKILQKSGSGAVAAATADQTSDNRTVAPFFATNTSLEEISDWLTKIIIGIGLVQFETILRYIFIAANASASFIDMRPMTLAGLQNTLITGSTAFFFAVIIACLLATCFFTYVETRTRLTLIFMSIEQTKQTGKNFTIAFKTPVAHVDEDAAANSTATPVQATAADMALASVPREQLKSAAEIAGWASAQARSGNKQIAVYALRDALQRDPGNPELMLRLGEIFRLLNQKSEYVETILDLIKEAPSLGDRLVSAARLAQTDALYLRPPEGFTKAIEISDFLDKTSAAIRPAVQMRRACAFGQKYKYYKDRDPSEASEARDDALAAARKVVELEPKGDAPVRTTLKQVLDPVTFGGPVSDNDLNGFIGDQEFEKVIIRGDLS